MKKMTMKVLFKNAWKLAKDGARQFGGSAKEYFATALKKAWDMKREFEGSSKDLSNKEIAAWFISKNYSSSEAYMIETSRRQVVRETEKAVNFKCYGKLGTKYIWVPKSCLV